MMVMFFTFRNTSMVMRMMMMMPMVVAGMFLKLNFSQVTCSFFLLFWTHTIDSLTLSARITNLFSTYCVWAEGGKWAFEYIERKSWWKIDFGCESRKRRAKLRCPNGMLAEKYWPNSKMQSSVMYGKRNSIINLNGNGSNNTFLSICCNGIGSYQYQRIHIFSATIRMYVWHGVYIWGSQNVFPFHTHRRTHTCKDGEILMIALDETYSCLPYLHTCLAPT